MTPARLSRTLLDRVFPPHQCCPARARQWDAVTGQGADDYETAARRQADEQDGRERRTVGEVT